MKLTERELQVLQGMAEGLSNAAIGRRLYIAEDSVKTHARKLFRRLGAVDRANAVALGYRRGLLKVDSTAVDDAQPAPPAVSLPRAVCHPHRGPGPSVRLMADDHDAALLSAAFFGPRPTQPEVALQRSRAAINRLVGAL